MCPGSSDPFYIASLLYDMVHYFLDILYIKYILFLIWLELSVKNIAERLNDFGYYRYLRLREWCWYYVTMFFFIQCSIYVFYFSRFLIKQILKQNYLLSIRTEILKKYFSTFYEFFRYQNPCFDLKSWNINLPLW